MSRVLIVEDSRMQAREFAVILQDAGIESDVVHDAESGYNRLAEIPFDLVLTDVYLPGSTGIELCARIKSDPLRRSTPVILITGWADPVNVLRGLEAGADGVVVKGSQSGDIVHRVQQALARAAARMSGDPVEETRVKFNDQEYILASDREQLLEVLLTAFQGVYELSQRYKQEVAERRQAEEALQKARDELEHRVEERTASLKDHALKLERSNRELEDFAYIASHDLQEPLRKIQAFGSRIGVALGDSPNPNVSDSLARMLDACTRLRKLINDLLSYSHVTTRAKPFESVDLAAVVREVVCDLEVALEESKGRVEIGELPVVDADPVQVRQLLQNLIGNALKFRRPEIPPVVRLCCRDEQAAAHAGLSGAPEPAFCEIVVEDNGIGFEPKFAERIFVVFQRLHGRGEYEGNGIGLAICRKIAERHNGSIRAEGEPGQGSRFTVTLPLSQSAKPRPCPC